MFRCPCIACYPTPPLLPHTPWPLSFRLYFRERLFAHHTLSPARVKLAGSSTAACEDGTLSLRGAGRAFAATFALSCCIFEAGCFRSFSADGNSGIHQTFGCCSMRGCKSSSRSRSRRSSRSSCRNKSNSDKLAAVLPYGSSCEAAARP